MLGMKKTQIFFKVVLMQVVKRITAPLATEKVSIKNIGIIHNREFEDGVLKIEFYTDAALEQAKVLLTKRNYKICER